jgi:hypothetical protein
MKDLKSYLLVVLTLALFAVLPATAQIISFTGNVEDDFASTNPNVLIIGDPGNTEPPAQPEINADGVQSGWDIKDIRLCYDPDNDVMYVGVNSFGIVGDVDGNGDPNEATNPYEYLDMSLLGGWETVAVYFDLDMQPDPFDNNDSWDLIAGVGFDFSLLDWKVCAWNHDTEFDPSLNFGTPLPDHTGTRGPSPQVVSGINNPDFEFSITNWSLLPTTLGLPDLNLNVFRVGGYMGSPYDGAIPEDTIFYQHDPVSEPDSLEKISGDGQSGEPNSTLPEPFVVRVVDQNGNPIEGIQVTFSIIAGGGSLDVVDTTTDADGLAESTLTLGPNPGINTVEVTAADINTVVTFEAIAEVELNQPPVAVDDSVTTHMGTSVDFNILANDTDPDGNSLTVTNFSSPTHGTLICNEDGQCQYTPDPGFVGADSFEYEISDGSLHATAIVTIYVTNSPPVAADDFVTTYMGTSVDFNLLTNDTDPDGDSLTVTYLSSPTNGVLIYNENGQCTYTPDAGFVGTDSFKYEISDGSFYVTATVTINVNVSEVDVAVDIKPQSCPNSLNVKRKGVLPVAVLGTEDFDVSSVDVGSVLLAGVAPLRFDYEDVATPFDGELCDCHEDGPDGILDLILHFDTQEIVEAIGPVKDGDELELILTCIIDGIQMEGSDCIRVIKKGKD